MIYGTFSIYDSKAEAFLPPFILPKTTMAQRAFADCVNSPEHQFGANPGDYTLFHLGFFDDENAKFQAHDTPQSLGLALEYIKNDTDPLKTDAFKPTEGQENGKDLSETPVTDDPPVRSDSSSSDSS